MVELKTEAEIEAMAAAACGRDLRRSARRGDLPGFPVVGQTMPGGGIMVR